MLTFLSPWWAACAVAAVGLPLLAHLLSRSRYREVMFPATRFVQQAVEQTTTLERPRHRLLMLLRWLLLLLVVLAFMRPQWLPEAAARDSEQGEALILLLDASASMQRSEAGATLYERALREADQLLWELDPARDVAAVIRVDRHAEAVLPEPTADIDLLRDTLSDSVPSYESAYWPAAVARAQRLAGATNRRVRIVVISDQQGEAPAFDGADKTLADAVIQHVRIDGPSENIAVQLVDVRPYPPVAGQSMSVIAELSNSGQETRVVTLQASLGDANARRAITLKPTRQQRVELFLRAPRADSAVLRLSVDNADRFELDNSAGHVLEVQEQTRTLIIHDNDSASSQLATRVATVLNPGEVEGLSLPTVSTASLDQAKQAMGLRDSASLRTVILLSSSRIDQELAEALDDFAERGGGVVQVIDDVQVLSRNESNWPASLVADGQRDAMDLSAARLDFALRPLRVFEGPARAGLAGLVWPGVDRASAGSRAVPILVGEDGRVIAAVQTLGRGRLIGINTDLSAGPGGLLAEPVFVVLFNELCRYASPGLALPPPALPGDTIPAHLLEDSSISWPEFADPNATRFTAPGEYFVSDRAGDLVDGLWVSLDPAESQIQSSEAWTAREDAERLLDAFSSSAFAQDPEADRDGQIELWPYFVLAALLLAAGESLMLWRFVSLSGGTD